MAKSWVLSFVFLFCFIVLLVFCFFLMLFSHCRKAKQKLSMLQNSERTIADVKCQWLQNAVKNHTPRVSPSVFLSEGNQGVLGISNFLEIIISNL